MALNPKQSLFVDEYLKDLNATQAAIRAGYSKKTADQQASRLLTNVKVREYLAQRQSERSKRIEITQDFVLQTILETVQRCRQVAPVLDRAGNQIFVETPDGEEAPAFEFDAKNVLKGLELLGKHLRVFSDKDELDIELKRIEIEKRRVELAALKAGHEPLPAVTKIEIEVVSGRSSPKAPNDGAAG